MVLTDTMEKLLVTLCLCVAVTSGQDARALIAQSIRDAVAEVDTININRAGTARAGAAGAFGPANAPVPGATTRTGLSGVPVGSSLWHHGRFTTGSDPLRTAVKDQNANVVMAAERNFEARGGPVGALRQPAMLMATFREQIAPFCTSSTPLPMCNANDPFRTADGTCNNLANPLWGASFTPQSRFLPPAYSADNQPRVSSVNGGLLPSARRISNIVLNAGTCSIRSRRNNIMFVTFGQFRDHDFTHTPVVLGPGNQVFDCCDPSQASNRDCFPIRVPPGDPRFTFKNCLSLTRSAAAVNNVCDADDRQQINQLTSYLDASAVYGSTLVEQIRLRGGAARSGGRLATSAGDLPPRGPDDTCLVNNTEEFCFEAGDVRVSEITSLTVLHIAFIRYHNIIARNLQEVNPSWNDERLFQESRKIVSAVLQHLTYAEYLPVVLGSAVMQRFGLNPRPFGFNNVYNPTVDASSRNAFGAAVFRFGHSQVSDNLIFLNRNFNLVRREPLENEFDRPGLMHLPNGVEFMSRWMLSDLQNNEDRRLQNSIRNFLFLDTMGDSFDLGAFNIQRGRDHGIPSYNRWRQFCGLTPATGFHGLGGLPNHGPVERELLRRAYDHVDDIDLFPGGLSEIPVPGGLVGPTFACIMGHQFRNFKIGDRFYYENNFPTTGFTEAQLNEIKKIRFSSIVCATLSQAAVQPWALQQIRRYTNPLISCTNDRIHPQLNFTFWNALGE